MGDTHTGLYFSATTPNGMAFQAQPDPTGYDGFKDDVTEGSLIEACGLIPTLMIDGDGANTFRQNIDMNYKFGHEWGTTAIINGDLMYQYPEDEPLPPLMLIENLQTGEQGLIYSYGLVAVTDAEGWITTKLD